MWDGVVDGDSFLEAGELDDVKDWDEEFFLQDLSILVNSNNSWVDVVTRFQFLDFLTTIENSSTFFLDVFNTFKVLFNGCFGVDWTADVGCVEWVTSLRVG